MEKKIILCVEDNLAVQMMNKPLLESKGYTVKMAVTIAQAKEAVQQAIPDLIILDIRLPDGNGLDFLREFRKTSTIPVIALTNNKEEQDMVEGLNAGCDDYIPKPYSLAVLGARIDAIMRRTQHIPDVITKGNLTLRVNSNQAFVDGKDIVLSTNIEFSLLNLFAKHENQILSTDFIYQEVWGQPMSGSGNAVKVAISELRKKMTGADYQIKTERLKGYCFRGDTK